MLTALGIVALLGTWHFDVSGIALAEAWDRNQSTETLVGAMAGIDRRVVQGVAARGEVLVLRVVQNGDDAWLRGFTMGPRFRWGGTRMRHLIDIAVGLSDATSAIPPGGTRFNYLALIGGGVEVPVRSARLAVTARWLHASNNGRDGRHRNPDIQSLGITLGVGWE